MSAKRVWLTDGDGNEYEAKIPFVNCAYVVVPLGESQCPKCNAIKVRGGGKSRESDDTWRADAYCLECREPRGMLRVRVDTLFGIEEDERVLNGRCRVY